jgi:hypothetical protein
MEEQRWLNGGAEVAQWRNRGGSMEEQRWLNGGEEEAQWEKRRWLNGSHLTAMQSPVFESGLWPAPRKLFVSLGGLPPVMAQHGWPASQGR